QVDPLGGFIVVENGEDQVRTYAQTGHITGVFGSGTERQDSLYGPTAASRLANGDLVATNFSAQRMTVIPKNGQETRHIETSPITLLEGVLTLNDDLVLLVGRDAPYPKNLLHIWDLHQGKVTRSFFPPPQHVDSNIALVIGTAYVAARGARLAAVHSLSDTLFIFDRAGNELSRAKIHGTSFDAPKGSLPNIQSLLGRQKWMSRWTLFRGIFWVDDSTIVVQLARGGRRDATYGLTRIDTAGRSTWSLTTTPRLLAVNNDQLYFQDPNPGSRNRLFVAVQQKPSNGPVPQPKHAGGRQ
ncbi:MAG: hypothetical protein ACYC2K_04035, partial [Gemmatimonadales bacterium]